jgi:hypothetical protein
LLLLLLLLLLFDWRLLFDRAVPARAMLVTYC